MALQAGMIMDFRLDKQVFQQINGMSGSAGRYGTGD